MYRDVIWGGGGEAFAPDFKKNDVKKEKEGKERNKKEKKDSFAVLTYRFAHVD